MKFDRDAAVGYAREYWDRPCDDGVFWRTDYAVHVDKMRQVLRAPAQEGWEARFVPDGLGTEHAVFQREIRGKVEQKEIQPWAGLADCAHFLSRCLTAGGFSVHEISVPTLVRHLKSRADTKVLAEQVSRERGQTIIDTGIFKKGDMLGYFNIDPQGDYGGRRQYSHSTMFIGKISAGDEGRITCHTKSRFGGLSAFPDEWHLADPAYLYTLIHIGRDDPAAFSSAQSLHGWWTKGDVEGRFYYFALDGRVTFTGHPPLSALDSPGAALNAGHYFADGARVTLIWKRGGDVELWQSLGDDAYATSANGTPGPHAERWTEARARGR